MQAAILNGILNLQSTPEFQCSGACTWDGKYTTLGVSSVCENVTQTAMATKVCSWPNELHGNCTIMTPSGLQLNTLSGAFRTVLIFATDIILPTAVAKDEEYSPDIARVAFFRNSSIYARNLDTDMKAGDYRGEDITECTLSFAVHEYEGITANGSQFRIDNRRTLKLDTSRLTHLPHDRLFVFNQSSHTPSLYVDFDDWGYMGFFLSTLAFNIDIVTDSLGIIMNPSNIYGVSLINMDIPNVFDAVAESMTNYIRSIPGPYAHRALGSRIDTIVFVQVRWEWLALPLSVEIMAVIFTLGVIRRNQIHRLPPWKSSALALVSYRLDPTMNALATEYGGPKEVERKARETTVRLASAQIT